MSAAALPELLLRIDRATVPASDKAAVAAAIEAANQRARLPGVPDAFNPMVIDPVKAEALLAALTGNSAGAVAVLGGRSLELNAMALRIGTSSPTTLASFATGVTLEVASEHGDMVAARAAVRVDCDLARDRSAEARRLTQAARRDVSAARGDAVMAAQLRRQALSRVWYDNASAHAACAPNDPAAKSDFAEATRVMKASVIIGGSME